MWEMMAGPHHPCHKLIQILPPLRPGKRGMAVMVHLIGVFAAAENE